MGGLGQYPVCHCTVSFFVFLVALHAQQWSEKFRRLRSDPVELSAAERSRLVFNSNSVLYASEDCSVQ